MLHSCDGLAGCGQNKKQFDYSRYNGKSIDSFLADFSLTKEDFEDAGAGSYKSKESLPFMDYEAVYLIICDEQDEIVCIDAFIIDELDNAEKLYEKAIEIEKVYDGIL